MAQAVRHLLPLTAVLVLLLAWPAAAQPPDTAPPGPATVTLPPDASVPVGPNPVTLTFPNGQQVQATIVVGPPDSGEPAGNGGPAGNGQLVGDDSLSAVLIAILSTVLLIGAGFLVYFKVIVPRRSGRAYHDAVALFAAGDYPRALPALTRIEGTLPERLRARARFYIAFALVRLENLDEAEHRLAAMHRENSKDTEAAYLLAYLRTSRRDYDGAEPVLAAVEAAGGLGEERVRQLYGIVKFHRALEALRDGRVDAAATLFEKVEQLGDFGNRIPADLRNRHVVLGAQALFDKDVTGAREQFESLEQAVAGLEPEQRETNAASAEIGLALAAWIENAPGSAERVEDLLVSAARRLDPDGATTMPWPEGAAELSVADRLAALRNHAADTGRDADLDRALRDIHFLRGAARLRMWASSPQAAEFAATHLGEALSRFACARDRDPDFSDTYLVVGLLRYYLADSDQARAAAAVVLLQAQKLGVREPEVLQILNRQARLGRATRDAVDAYLQVLDRFVEDGSVREQVRLALVQRLSRYRKVRGWDSRAELAQVRAVAPTVAEMNDRSELLRERVNQLLIAREDAEELVEARELTRSLENDGRILLEHARSVEQKEAELLALVGDRLLAENER